MSSQNKERFTDEQKRQLVKLVDDTADEVSKICFLLKVLAFKCQIAARNEDFESAVEIMRELEKYTNEQRISDACDVVIRRTSR